jgi:hypothetical protein
MSRIPPHKVRIGGATLPEIKQQLAYEVQRLRDFDWSEVTRRALDQAHLVSALLLRYLYLPARNEMAREALALYRTHLNSDTAIKIDSSGGIVQQTAKRGSRPKGTGGVTQKIKVDDRKPKRSHSAPINHHTPSRIS